MTMKLTFTYPTAMALAAIGEGHRYGFDIMDTTGLPDGTVYPILRRLESRGYLVGRWEDGEVALREGRPARRYYELTGAGDDALQAALAKFPRLSELFPEAGRQAASL
jgi:DNA-binding PadR family transcriptional regulator